MTAPKTPVIDCDFHVPQADVSALLPFLDTHWRRQVADRELPSMPFRLTSYPAAAPQTVHPDAADLTPFAALDRSGADIAIASDLHGVVALHNPDMRAALMRAVNDHMAATWLDADPRLRGSIFVSTEDPSASAAEIDRLAPDVRFVQVVMLAGQDLPHGHRRNWPIFDAAQRHGLTVAIHGGSLYRHPPGVAGWPSYQFESHVLQSQIFENILVSLMAEGVFRQFPDLRVVFLESGFAWLPTTLWRMDKTWRGTRQAVPWIDRRPSEILEGRFFVSMAPCDPPDAAALAQTLRHIGRTDLLLHGSDFPHDPPRAQPLPDGIPEGARPGILGRNALDAYPRLAAEPAFAGFVTDLEDAT